MIKDRIRELREKNNLTMAAFARSLGISPTSASLYESGKQNPGKKTIAKMCEVYGVDEAWLMDTASKAVATPAKTTIATSTKPVVNKGEKKPGKKVPNKEIDKTAILARVAEIGVRKAADEAGIAWQTVNKWKRDAAAAFEEVKTEMPTPDDTEEVVKEMPTPDDTEEVVKEMPTPDDIEEVVANLPTLKEIEEAPEELTTPDDLKEGLEAFATVAEMVAPEEKKDTAVITQHNEEESDTADEGKKEQIDINAVLGRVAEIGLRKAAEEVGVAWQTVNKWKKDAEKAAAALGEVMPIAEDLTKGFAEAAGEIAGNIKGAAEKLTTPEGVQEAVTKVMEMVAPAEGEKKQDEKKDIDINDVLARVAEIGLRKAAAEVGVAWQTVNKWKRDAVVTPAKEQKKEEKREQKEQKPEEKKDAVRAAEVIEEPKPEKTNIIIQSPMGGAVTPEQILAKIPSGADSVYVRVDENKLYWVKGEENGAVEIW